MPQTPVEQVRLLIASPGTNEVFTDLEINTFLQLERDRVKLAAARALTVIAVNEALVSKVIKDGNLSTDGAKLAAELRALAKELRESHAVDVAEETETSDDGFYFGVVDLHAGGW